MQHVTALENLRLTHAACVTLGAFDGVHRGHQALIKQMVRRAHANGHEAVIITFHPHPAVVLRGPHPAFYLTAPEEKAEQLAALGVDAIVTHPFTLAVSQVSAADFVDRLRQHARLTELWCGPDFALGRGREGSVAYLQSSGARLGFSVQVVPPLVEDGEVVSSTRIRQALRAGQVELAAQLLGRPFRLAGQVVEGAQRGRTIGIPTANLAVWDEQAFPAVGVYACRAVHDRVVYPAVANIGFRPTFAGGEAQPTIEAHLLDFSGDLYGAAVSLDFVARLRAELKFSGIEALVAQIQQDIAQARVLLAKPT
jgi:riboflavin kinase/FMN adenylyltransferase